MLQKILKFAFENKKSFLFFGMFLSLFFLTYSTGFATGDEPVLKPEDAEKVVKILNGFIMGAAALMGMVTSFITLFLYPGWINGTLFGLDEYLKEIWILISNVVYFIFAFILIAIAFMNIIGKGEGTWELKQAMPKFIVGVLIVPFSWFFVQLVLSVCSVLTVGVLTLPYDSFKDKELFSQALEKQQFAEEKICKDIVIAFDGDFSNHDVEDISTEENGLDENIKCKTDGKLTIKELLTGKDENGNASGKAAGLQNSIFGVISIYSYGILRIHELDTISSSQIQNMRSIADLVFKIVFDLLFIAVYLLLMIALLLALFVRGIRLWIFAMLSPFFGLLYFFGKGSEGIGSDKNKFSIKEFISLALVPVYVSAALAFGLVFILVASTGLEREVLPEDETMQIGGFSLTLTGAHGDGEVEVSIIGKLIVEIFGVVILWIAVMAALGASNTTKNIVEPIQQFGNSVGDLAMKAPTYAPIIPSSMGGSVAGLQSLGSSITSGIDSHFKKQGTDRGADFAEDILGGSTPSASYRRETAPHIERADSGDRTAIQSVVSGMMSQTSADRIRDREFRRAFVDDLGRILKDSNGETTVTEAERTALLGASNPTQFAQVLRDILRDPNISQERRTAIQDKLGGVTLGSISADAVTDKFNLGGTATPTQTQDPGTPPTGSGTTNNITINGIGSGQFTSAESAARAFKDDSSFADAAAVRTRLQREDDLDSSVIDSIVDAYESLSSAATDATDGDGGDGGD